MAIPPRNANSVTEGERGRSGVFTRIQLGPVVNSQSGGTFLVLGTTLALVGVGLVMVLSSSSINSYLDNQGFFGGFWKQLTFAAVGVPLMMLASKAPLVFWKKWAWLALASGLVLQLLVFSPLGIETYGNRNWISIGGLSGQPSEFLKLALILWMGAVLYRRRSRIQETWGALNPVIWVAAVAMGLVVAGRDLGTAMIFALITMAALYFAGAKWRTMLMPVLVMAAGVLLLVVTSPNRMSRILTNCGSGEAADYSGLCWQPLHGLWALAGGGVFGVGLGNSRAKWSWLPAADNDYIFAIIGEETGMIGAIIVLLLFVALAFGILHVMRNARDLFGVIVSGTIFVWIIGQALINIGVVIGILPVLGVPLPLISSGGTALISNLLAIGVVLSIARDSDLAKTQTPSTPVSHKSKQGSR